MTRASASAVLRALAHARRHQARFVAELAQFLRFPSVSSQPRHRGDVERCARWLAQHLRTVGMHTVQVLQTAAHPVVLASWRRRPGSPTVLIYGHYDVQPPEPLREWRTPPFEPRVRGGRLYARGASDNKGQLFAHVKAIESWLATSGALPVNVVCVFEGDEEVGSPQLPEFLRRHCEALRADVAVVSDTAVLAPDRPAITHALRGGLSVELDVRGPAADLHSGSFGGAVHNPIQVLAELISGLHDERGRVTIPGFYDRVRAWSAATRARIAASGPSDEEMQRAARVRRPWGEEGFSLHERVTIRPALTVNGVTGGHQGPGGKGIIPARASAKLNLRLVPDQDPHEIERLLRAELAKRTPDTVELRCRTSARSRPALVDTRSPWLLAAAAAYERVFGARPVFRRSGGTIPVVSRLRSTLGLTPVLMGFGLPDDRIHAPNEKLDLTMLARGIAVSTWFLAAGESAASRARAVGEVAVPSS